MNQFVRVAAYLSSL